MPMEQAMQAIAGPCAPLHQATTMGQERAQFPNLFGWDPNRREKASCQQPGQGERVTRIGLDLGRANGFNEQRVGDLHGGHQWHQLIVEVPGIGGGFQHHVVTGGQVDGRPVRKRGEWHATWRQEDVLISIDGGHHDVVPMHIQGNEQ